MIYSKAIITSHVFVPRKEVEVSKIIQGLTVVSRFDKKRFKMFKIVRGWFGFPIHFFAHPLTIANHVEDRRIFGDKVKFRFKAIFREGQGEVCAKFDQLFAHGKTGFIFEAKPGAGKTVCCIKFLETIRRKALVIVPRSNLVQQWVDRLVEHSSLSYLDIGRVCGDDIDWKNKKIVIGLVHTLGLDRLGKDFKKMFGCVVFDEVHSSVPPETFAPIATMFPARVRIGMSATLERDDGLDVIFRNHIGEMYLKGKMTGRMPAKILMQEFKKSSGYVHPKSKVLNRRGMLISRVAVNPARNLLITKYIISFLRSNRRVVILSDRILQLKLLNEMLLKKYSNIKCKDVGFYIADKKKKNGELRRVASDCKVILATYGMFDLGTDIPDLAGMVYATPCKNVQQKIGRIERILAEKKQPVVVDIVDTFYSDTRRWASFRKKFYCSSGLIIKEIK